jgi:PadR family transcriptional regulator
MTVHLFMLTIYRYCDTLVDSKQERSVKEQKSELLHGTLDLMVLKTLNTMGSLHGYGLARRIEQVAEGSLSLNQGTVYPALLRLEQRGWISSDWGVSENNRRARYYSITRSGKRQLIEEEANWHRTVATLTRLLGSA